MCLIGVAYKAHPRYELVLAANRDEFHARPAAAAAWWADAPEVYGGRDLSQGGAWLALSARRRFAAVTNVRRMQPPLAGAPSRGALVADFARGTQGAHDYAHALASAARRYSGFNLLLWDGTELVYVSNEPEFLALPVAPGVHGISNAALDTHWPKLRRLSAGLQHWLTQADDEDALFALLADERAAADADLPDTGVGLDMERFLSPPFIRGTRYGTRASSVLRIGADAAWFGERRFGPDGAALGQSRERIAFKAS
jgi:uncharacterized protein with NRDE domain